MDDWAEVCALDTLGGCSLWKRHLYAMVNGASYTVSVSSTGLLARPSNDIARKAIVDGANQCLFGRCVDAPRRPKS